MENPIRGLTKYFQREKFEIGREVLLSILVSTIITGFVTFYWEKQLDSRVAQREFLFDFSRTYFDNPKYRNISIAIEEDYLYGHRATSTIITDYDWDDYLGLLYDIWSYHKDGFVSREVLDRQYSYYLCITQKSPLVLGYRKKLSGEGFSAPAAYSFLEDVAKELGFENKKCEEI